MTQPYRKNNEEQWLESTNLSLQEGRVLESTRGCVSIHKHLSTLNKEITIKESRAIKMG